MDNHERRQRQSNASGFAAQQHPHHQHHPSGGGPSYRQPGQQPVPVQPGAAAIQSARSIASQGAMPPSAYPPAGAAHPHGYGAAPAAAYDMPAYAAEFSQDSARPVQPQAASQQQSQQSAAGQQAQGSPQYPAMYGFQQTTPQQQPTPPTPYDAVQPYPPPRQSAAIEVLTNQFGMPPGYYVAGDGPGGPTGPTSAPVAAAALAQQQQGVQQPYAAMGYATTQSPPIGREAMVPGYAMADPAVANPVTAAAPPSTPGSQGAFGPPSAYAPQQTSELDNAYGSYANELRRTFENTHDGLLAEAGSSLIRISDWLLTNADTLGKSWSFISLTSPRSGRRH
jgi:hypothetical protein